MASYKLTAAAEVDLENILEYGIDKFGLEQAVAYYDKLSQRFLEITENPLLYQSVDDIRAGYRRSVCGVHSIYYQIAPNADIFIIRIINHQNLLSSFEE